jgi:hypothetical protein
MSVRSVFEILILALFAVVISFLASSFIEIIRSKKMPDHHSFNNPDLYFRSYLTAVFAILFARALRFTDIIKQF